MAKRLCSNYRGTGIPPLRLFVDPHVIQGVEVSALSVPRCHPHAFYSSTTSTAKREGRSESYRPICSAFCLKFASGRIINCDSLRPNCV